MQRPMTARAVFQEQPLVHRRATPHALHRLDQIRVRMTPTTSPRISTELRSTTSGCM